MEEENEVYSVSGRTDSPASDVIEPRRYQFEIRNTNAFVSDAGNNCIGIDLEVDGHKISDTVSFDKKSHPFLFHKGINLLYSIGIREKGTSFSVPKERMIGGKGLVDIGIKDRKLDDGTKIPQNVVRGYSPIEEETAPMRDVPPEEGSPETEQPKEKPKKEAPKEETKKPETIDDDLEV